MSLMGIIDWMRKKIVGESKKEPPTVTPIGHATDEHRAEIEVAKEEEDRKEAEVRGRSVDGSSRKRKRAKRRCEKLWRECRREYKSVASAA